MKQEIVEFRMLKNDSIFSYYGKKYKKVVEVNYINSISLEDGELTSFSPNACVQILVKDEE